MGSIPAGDVNRVRGMSKMWLIPRTFLFNGMIYCIYKNKRRTIKKWENVYIFISSTFNDMYAERDYLVKRVFPELRLWCNKRNLKLIDVDLR